MFLWCICSCPCHTPLARKGQCSLLQPLTSCSVSKKKRNDGNSNHQWLLKLFKSSNQFILVKLRWSSHHLSFRRFIAILVTTLSFVVFIVCLNYRFYVAFIVLQVVFIIYMSHLSFSRLYLSFYMSYLSFARVFNQLRVRGMLHSYILHPRH